MKCEICNTNPADGGKALYRINPLGEVGVFRCWECLTPEQREKQDAETVRLTKIIEKGE